MKRNLFWIFFISILGISTLEANEKSGIFIGGDVGFGMNTSHGSVDLALDTDPSLSASATRVIFNLSYGVRAAYQQWFGSLWKF